MNLGILGIIANILIVVAILVMAISLWRLISIHLEIKEDIKEIEETINSIKNSLDKVITSFESKEEPK